MTLKSHRWISGTFGPDLSFGSIIWHAADESLVKVGYLVRDGVVAQLHNVYYIDSICAVRFPGNPHRWGVCDFEVSNNARLGTAPIATAISARLADGMTERP
jgi:hypothetical protein